MPDHDLFLGGMWHFAVRGGQTVKDGKVYYPSHLWVRLDQRDALDLIESIVRSLRLLSGGEPIEVSWPGKLTERGEEEP